MENENENEECKKNKEGENTKFPVKGFFPTDLKMELEEIDIGSTIVYIEKTIKAVYKRTDILNFWEAFKIQYFTGQKYYENIHELKQHFRDWVKIQKNGAKNTGHITEPATPDEYRL